MIKPLPVIIATQVVAPTRHREQVALTGYTFAWQAEASSDAFRQLGIDSVTAGGEAIVQMGKLKAFTMTLTPETLAERSAALASSPLMGLE